MKTALLEDVCEILDSKRKPVTAKDRVAGPYPYYGANGKQDSVDGYLFDDELVLLAEDGGNFGVRGKKIAYRVSGKCWVNNHAHVLKAKDCLDIDYLCLALESYDVSKITNGATRKKLNQSDMRKMAIPMRSIGEQKAVVSLFKHLCSQMNASQLILTRLDELIKSRFTCWEVAA